MDSWEEMSIENVCGGGVPEAFQREMKQIFENYLDPNCDPKAKRSLTLTFTFAGNEERNGGNLRFDVKTKLAPHKTGGGMIALTAQGVPFVDKFREMPLYEQMEIVQEENKKQEESNA